MLAEKMINVKRSRVVVPLWHTDVVPRAGGDLVSEGTRPGRFSS